ncbi:MAG: outer membrane lipoprotein-sorting protein [Desulfobulbaceae bacterium]|uniref:Outer membrane lipoprotein-sorting protein n=1 Tax=Candidatus Desulfatifera sulfidica TaxID=2841691 RepID=A0A8J6N804_9BACT|nr:outer membrane lipoprotein-sorting protein [Candidatus Desulfatifera sulfidica]
MQLLLRYSLIGLILFSATPLVAADAESLLQEMEDRLYGDTAIIKLAMVVGNRRGERRMEMESYSSGRDRNFIKITYPAKDRGITFLKIDNGLWQYVPRIEKIIKIPAAMMLQSWMGSDFSNDDLVRESLLSRDYHSSISAEDDETWTLELTARAEAPVVWGRLLVVLSREHLLPLRVDYYDEENQLIRTLEYSRYSEMGGRIYPARWFMQPREAGQEERWTRIDVMEAAFDLDIPEETFSKRALKRLSR